MTVVDEGERIIGMLTKRKGNRGVWLVIIGVVIWLISMRIHFGNGLRRGTLDCTDVIRLGDAYGGWEMCRPLLSIKGRLVYTIGVGRNIGWDEAMIKQFGSEHHGWDPTPTALDFVKKNDVVEGFTFHAIGLGKEDGNVSLKLPIGNQDSYTVMEYNEEAREGSIVQVGVLTLRSMMKKVGHGDKELAVLKVDIEGAEFDVVESWVKEGYRIPADQVLIEFHQRYFKHTGQQGKLLRKAMEGMAKLGFEMVIRTNLVSFLFFFAKIFPVY